MWTGRLMAFNAEDYRIAAEEHVTAANQLYGLRRWALAHYVAGLAVECMFRAYRVRIDPQFDEKHYLGKLAKASGFLDIISSERVEVISAALSEVEARWQNDHRFRSEESLRRFLVERKLYLRIKGDFVKESSRRIVNAATELVNLGARQWHR